MNKMSGEVICGSRSGSASGPISLNEPMKPSMKPGWIHWRMNAPVVLLLRLYRWCARQTIDEPPTAWNLYHGSVPPARRIPVHGRGA